jgi:hypothetical protein
MKSLFAKSVNTKDKKVFQNGDLLGNDKDLSDTGKRISDINSMILYVTHQVIYKRELTIV